MKRLLVVVLLAIAFPGSAFASHSWGNYHWPRTSNPFTVTLQDQLTTPVRKQELAIASADWSRSSVLDTVVASSGGTRNVTVQNAAYGNTGWVGIATIWINSVGHIATGSVRINDTYLAQPAYSDWGQFVMCQEIGHTFGLDHQDENFRNANLGTCMDYTVCPTGGCKGRERKAGPLSNEHPNAHDYEQLELIYAHLDARNSAAGMKPLFSRTFVIPATNALPRRAT